MTEQETVERVREEIEEKITWIIFNRFAKTLGYWPPRFRQLTEEKGSGRLPEEFYKLTSQILSIPEILIKHPDQSLPPNPQEYQPFYGAHIRAQQDMLKANWQRVIEVKE